MIHRAIAEYSTPGAESTYGLGSTIITAIIFSFWLKFLACKILTAIFLLLFCIRMYYDGSYKYESSSDKIYATEQI